MTVPSLLGHAAELVRIIRKSPQPADALASEYMRSKKYIGASDRRFISSIVFETLRTLSRCELLMQHGGYDDVVHAAYALREGEVTDMAWLDAAPDHVRCCTQEWLLESTRRRWTNDAVDVWTSMMQPAPLCLRVNLRRTSRSDVLRALRAEGVNAEEGRHATAAIIIHDRVNLLQHGLYTSGLVDIQDEGSQLIGLACDAQPGMRVLDACAGAGGKALHLADIMQDRGEILARDIEWNRLKEIRPRAQRAGVRSITVEHIRGGTTRSRTAPFDIVLVDAPCSGMGTVRRMPMVKWRLTPEQAERHAAKQLRILTQQADHVAEGGALVYATCSILPVENEDVVHRFLADLPMFALEAQRQSDPFHDGTDGLYWARLRRNA